MWYAMLQVCDHHRNKENSSNDEVECYRKVKDKVGQSESDSAHQIQIPKPPSATATTSAPPPSTQSSRFLSRFSFIPGNISFRLSRTNSLGSSTSYPISLFNNEERGPPIPIDADQNHPPSPLLPMSFIHTNSPPTLCSQDTSTHHLLLNNTPNLGDSNLTNHSEVQRQPPPREPIDRNVRFSRTLSVGRLRDRVLRRSSLSDVSFCPVQQLEEVRNTNQAWVGDQTRTLASEPTSVASPNPSPYPSSIDSSSLFSIQDYEVETSQAREARYHDLLEHRSNFLERRRRIRSQVCIYAHSLLLPYVLREF